MQQMKMSLQWDSKCPACSGQPAHTPKRERCQKSLLSQIQLLIYSLVNRYYLQESDPCLDLSSSSPHLTRTLQASNSALCKASAVATPAKAVPHSAPYLPSPPPRPLRFSNKRLLPPNSSYPFPSTPFPRRTLLLPNWSTQAPMAMPTTLPGDQSVQAFPNLRRAV